MEAIEFEFVPLLIVNNRPGRDASLLKRFGEPSWNYQVVRFFDDGGRDVIPRAEGVWTTGGMVRRMIAALERAKRPVPLYLLALGDAFPEPGEFSQVAFEMPRSGLGESAIGQLEGVVMTEAGWVDGGEVTLVEYDPSRLTLRCLAEFALVEGGASRVYLERAVSELADARMVSLARVYRKADTRDQMCRLQGTDFELVELLPTQATKVDAWCGVDLAKAMAWLSPLQRAKLRLR